MNYKRVHDNIIYAAQKRKIDANTEKHYIIPMCMGGTDDVDNIVELTSKEHYVVHQLLIKMYPGATKLIHTVNQMSWNRNSKKDNNRSYRWLRKLHAQSIKSSTFGFQPGHEPYKPKKPFTYNGHTYPSGKAAAAALGVSEGTISNWRKQYTNWISQYTIQQGKE